MSFLRAIRDQWTAMSLADKIKFVLECLAQAGGAAIAGDIAGKAAEDKKPLTRVCITVAGAGLGMAAGTVATNALHEAVDNTVELIEMRKEAAANKAKEGAKDA